MGIWIFVRIKRWTMNTLIPLITLKDYRCQNSNWWAIATDIQSYGTSRQNENKPQCGQDSSTTRLKNAELDQSVKFQRHFFIPLLNLQIEETIINDELPDRWLFPELINVSPLKYDLRPHYPHKWSLRYFYHPWNSTQFVKSSGLKTNTTAMTHEIEVEQAWAISKQNLNWIQAHYLIW